MTRIGKIGRLEKKLRDELGHRIENGAAGADLVQWLNEQPNTQTVVARFFDGKGITEQNLSDWKRGGHAEWVRRQAAQEALIQFVEHGSEMQELTRGRDVAGQLVSVMLAEMVQVVSGLLETETDLEKRWQRLREVHRELSRLRRDEDRAAHTHMERVDWAWRDAKERGYRGEEEERFNRNLQRWQSEAFEEARKDLLAKANGVEAQGEEPEPVKGWRQKGKGARSKGEVGHRGTEGTESTEGGKVDHPACADKPVKGRRKGRKSRRIVANRVKKGVSGEGRVTSSSDREIQAGEGCHRGTESTEGGKVDHPACANKPVKGRRKGRKSRRIVANRVKKEGTDGTQGTDEGIAGAGRRTNGRDARSTIPMGEQGPENSQESGLIVADPVKEVISLESPVKCKIVNGERVYEYVPESRENRLRRLQAIQEAWEAEQAKAAAAAQAEGEPGS